MTDYKNRITHDNITKLAANQVLVVPTNEAGRHGAGLARFAALNFGLKYGHGWHVCGRCFALPTKDRNIQTLPLEKVRQYVEAFIGYAKKIHERGWDFVYLVPMVGCGLAGFKPEQIAPLFKDAIDLPNVHLPKSFWEVLEKMEQ
jgi:hypothetical protein